MSPALRLRNSRVVKRREREMRTGPATSLDPLLVCVAIYSPPLINRTDLAGFFDVLSDSGGSETSLNSASNGSGAIAPDLNELRGCLAPISIKLINRKGQHCD